MTQHLIRTLTDSTGHPFVHITKARENETFAVVEAESKEEAEKMVMGEVILRPVITKNYQPPEFDDVSGDKNNLSVEEMRKRLKKGQ